MAVEKAYCVYLLTNFTNRVIYTGVTNDLVRRVREDRDGTHDGFTKKYKVWKLVHFERYQERYRARKATQGRQ